MRTPLIAHWPAGFKDAGCISHELGHIVDIMSTCIELTGTTYPKEYQSHKIKPAPGISLLPIPQAKS